MIRDEMRKEKIVVQKATYGVLTDAARTRDVTAKLQKLVDGGAIRFPVAQMAEGDDPAFLVVKTLIVEYTIDGKPAKATGQDPETIDLLGVLAAERVAEVHADAKGGLQIDAWKPGRYELKTGSGKTLAAEVRKCRRRKEIAGPWEVRFPPNWGAPEKITLDKLVSWSEHPEDGVKYFSGTATYVKKIEIPREMLAANRRIYLDLGRVQVMARVKLNGKDLGVLWKTPYRVDITEAAKPGENSLGNRSRQSLAEPDDRRRATARRQRTQSRRHAQKMAASGCSTESPARPAASPSPPGGSGEKTRRLLESGLLGPVQLQSVERVAPK